MIVLLIWLLVVVCSVVMMFCVLVSWFVCRLSLMMLCLFVVILVWCCGVCWCSG